jgi:hypothetical protein
MLRDVSFLLQRLAAKAERLIGNFTTNLAECWMQIRSKFDGGKLFNRTNRGSWHARCYGGALRLNLGPTWSPIAWEKATSTTPGPYFQQTYASRARRVLQCRKERSQPDFQKRLWLRKHRTLSTGKEKRARLEYGAEAVDVIPDCSQVELDKAKDEFLNTHILLNRDQLLGIRTSTKAQSQSRSGVWQQERKKRLTASNFGSVVCRRPSLKVEPLVRRLLYGTFEGTTATRWGLSQESITIKEYVLHKASGQVNASVEPVGLCINEHHPYLAASPYGIVTNLDTGDQGLLEIKNVLRKKSINLTQAAKTDKAFCLELVSGFLRLKRRHAYYFQCQGQLNILNLPWLDFVIRTVDPYQLHVETIMCDSTLWTSTMLPKLTDFYNKSILPELAVPRHGKSPGIREPGVWVSFENDYQGKYNVFDVLFTGTVYLLQNTDEDDDQMVPNVSLTLYRSYRDDHLFSYRYIIHLQIQAKYVHILCFSLYFGVYQIDLSKYNFMYVVT